MFELAHQLGRRLGLRVVVRLDGDDLEALPIIGSPNATQRERLASRRTGMRASST